MGMTPRAAIPSHDTMAAALGFTLFSTPLGPCGIAWGERGLVGVQLPEGSESDTRSRLARRFGAAKECAPPPVWQRAAEDIAALLRGDPKDLLDLSIDDEDLPDFNRQVYAIARRIQPGQTRTYGEIAIELGDASAARAVGQALGRNPFPIVVPCHRVLAAGGKLGGFSARGGVVTKLRLLGIEGARIPEAMPGLFDDEALPPPTSATAAR
jgi:methylated-DNA-[protein]-cysteine S-methyltransferase